MSSGNFNLRTLASFVTASIFSGCIIPPLFQSFWQNSAESGISLWQAYANSLYRNAAVGNRNWIDYLVLTILVALVTLVPFLVLASYVWLRRGEKPKKSAPKKDVRTGLMIAVLPLLAINLCVGALVVNYAYSDLQLNASFEQYLTALGPSLTDMEIKQLRSQWALMSSEEDCRRIFTAIVQKSEEAGIQLPIKLYF